MGLRHVQNLPPPTTSEMKISSRTDRYGTRVPPPWVVIRQPEGSSLGQPQSSSGTVLGNVVRSGTRSGLTEYRAIIGNLEPACSWNAFDNCDSGPIWYMYPILNMYIPYTVGYFTKNGGFLLLFRRTNPITTICAYQQHMQPIFLQKSSWGSHVQKISHVSVVSRGSENSVVICMYTQQQ